MHSKASIQLAAIRRQEIVEFISTRYAQGKPTAWHDIRHRFDWCGKTRPRLIQDMLDRQLICVIGNALDAGRDDLRWDNMVYAPFGTPALKRIEKPSRYAVKPPKYKGERTGPRYWNAFSTPELSPHDYDLYAGRNLAMLAR